MLPEGSTAGLLVRSGGKWALHELAVIPPLMERRSHWMFRLGLTCSCVAEHARLRPRRASARPTSPGRDSSFAGETATHPASLYGFTRFSPPKSSPAAGWTRHSWR